MLPPYAPAMWQDWAGGIVLFLFVGAFLALGLAALWRLRQRAHLPAPEGEEATELPPAASSTVGPTGPEAAPGAQRVSSGLPPGLPDGGVGVPAPPGLPDGGAGVPAPPVATAATAVPGDGARGEDPRSAASAAVAAREGGQASAAIAARAPGAASRPSAPDDASGAGVRALIPALARTKAAWLARLDTLLSRGPAVDTAVLDDLEELLLTADVGVALTDRLLAVLRRQLEAGELGAADAVRAALRAEVLAALGRAATPAAADAAAAPRVILFVGVNGAGKTTTVGKLAAQLTAEGRRVVLAAGDTYRAAAAEQLAIWAERSGATLVRGEAGSDPASVVFRAIQGAAADGAEVVLADTAGRLHTHGDLMDELKKVRRVAGKARAGAPDEVWLVLDATTGQNALQQARAFHEALGVTGVILTKLDGTAKGGVVVAIADSLALPVRYIGLGEQVGDLRAFDAETFVAALFAP